ncbi:NAD(P)H-dependent oxidoreductase [Stappia sp. F7233]|uniref:NAD(P)H-dependent oxidoreductase n=1 Tax=Stappia albiluteola TaxID=2758565 RepID=A0A839AAV4_9HYPH|nr:NAD(P)H-dependent oxidoreductase [Stappia albiluteola]MBA5776072.1 NAD(P)H-dependent oxidoreductase [Stappia albiluteola]
MRTPRILVFAGSTRTGSYNGRLADHMVQCLEAAGAEVTRISLADYPLPIFNADLEREEGAPENSVRLKALFQRHDGIFIASPEYNTSITPLLKNTLDWVSRLSEDGEPPSAAFKNRVFAVGAASPGQFGGMRGLIGLRTILEIGVGAFVIPEMVSIPKAKDAFDEDGRLKEGPPTRHADALVKRLLAEVALRSG